MYHPMKKTFTLLFTSFSLFCFAQQQGPVIEATYLPVLNTSILEMWDTTAGHLHIPQGGENIFWDYDNDFSTVWGPYKISTFHPDSVVAGASLKSRFPDATHATYLTTPYNNFSDKLYSCFKVDTNGLSMVGGRSVKPAPILTNNTAYVVNDTTITFTIPDFLTPTLVYYGMDPMVTTSKYVTYGKANAFGMTIPLKSITTRTKTMIAYGYGSLKVNNTHYNNVILAKVTLTDNDSVFGSTGNLLNFSSNNYIEYSFLRNNTFGTAFLVYLLANSANNTVSKGWYTLPVDFGSISGTVFTDNTESTAVTKGVAYLYREFSNFSKNDILDIDTLDSNGNYQFDSIPYGEYRVSARPDLTMYPNNLTTYYGDTTNGNDAPVINTSVPIDSNSTGNNIHLQYHTDSVGLGQISGTLNLIHSFGIIANPDLNNGIRSNNPIPGVDIIVRSKPGGIAMREIKTDPLGYYSIGDLDNGAYDLFVDIPGLLMKGTYEFEIAGATAINCLDFTSGMDSIHHYVCQDITTNVPKSIKSANLLDVYPNPYKFATTVKINVSVKSTVLLEVYNVLGEKIQTLDNSEKIAGSYSYNFSAKALNYSAGLYFIKLSMGNNVSVLKIMEQ